jgi:CubicO group peptidase (beta-lactamase class C family)
MDVEALPGHIADLTRAEMTRLRVPGAAVGVIAGGRWYAGGFGVTHVGRALPVTADTLFQTGSTSKTFCATALMMLADEGRVDIELPVRAYLPGLKLQSEEDAERVTVRHLLTHHGGWMGDYFKDMGRGNDALALMVEKMADAKQITPAGFAFAYSNAGFNVLARIVEVVSGSGFEDFVQERILDPLGMRHSTYFADQAIVHSVAHGHFPTAAGPAPSERWAIARSIAGSSGVVSSVMDQLRYAAFHMADGTTDGGQRLLSEAALVRMRSPQAAAGSMCDEIGLSWMLDNIGGQRLVKHGGAINGQLSSFEFVPVLGYACTVLTNCDSGREMRSTVGDACLRHFTGLERTLPEADPALAARAGEYAGRYSQRLFDLTVEARDGRLVITERTPERMLQFTGAAEEPPFEAVLFAPDAVVVLDGSRRGERAEFLRDDSGAIAWMRWDGRLSRRLEA